MLASAFGLAGPRPESCRAFAEDGVFRLSVGLEDPEDLTADSDRLL